MKKLILLAISLLLCLTACAGGSAAGLDDNAPQAQGESLQEATGEAGPDEPSPAPEAFPTAAEAAEKLAALGIMRGVKTGSGIDYMLSEPVTREAALTLIARAMGHGDAPAETYPASGFTDVDDWAAGSVNYAKARGITNGISETLLGSGYEITQNEFAAMLLRSLGYGDDFTFDGAYSAALERGVMQALEAETVTRGDVARGILTLISAIPKSGGSPLLEGLLETGAVTAGSVEAAGLSGLVTSTESGHLTAAEVYAENSGRLATLDCYDRAGALIRSVHGAFISDYTLVAAFDDIYGAKRVVMTHGDEVKEIIGINFYDEASGIVSLSYYADDPHPHFPAPAEPSSGTVYVLSASASGEDYGGAFSVRLNAARPVVDARGNFIGLTQRGSNRVKNVFNWDWFSGGTERFRSFAARYWPELLYPRGLDPEKKMIALTFDDGPSRSLTPKFLDLLEQYGAVATFFECGNMLKANPQYLERMEELGCEVGNHTYSHPNLNSLSQEKVISQISDTDALIEEKLGHKAALVRAPYGNSNAKVREAIDRPIIYWTLDTLDWQSRNADAVFNKIAGYSFDGCIVLMHSIHEPTYRACLKAIPWLIEQGYQLVTVSEMAECRGYDLENGTVYYSFTQQ